MTVVRSRGVALLIGATSWTATEYVLHRFVMREMRGRGLPSIEHLKHHADVTCFSPASRKLASAAGTTSLAYAIAAARPGRRWASVFTSGLIATHFAADYLVKGARCAELNQGERDRSDAFANLAPEF